MPMLISGLFRNLMNFQTASLCSLVEVMKKANPLAWCKGA